MKMTTLEDLFLEELRDMYHGEHQLVKALPKMAKSAANPDLQQAFEDHLEETKGQVERLEEIFEKLGTRPRGKRCEGIEGMVAEAKELMEQDVDDDVLDAGLIAGAQKVEHYEIASYGTLRTWAQQLGHDEIAELLQETLDEEGAADKKLTAIAESSVNQEAAGAR